MKIWLENVYRKNVVSTRNASPNIQKHGFVSKTSFYMARSKTRKPRKSGKYYSEFSYFRVFDFALEPKSKTRK